MAEVECITLDEDEDQDLLQGAGRMASHPQMVRCAMCVDPGLLPMETDMAKHRREVHRSKLFYCDICDPSNPCDRGARGFVGYEDAAKHISQENGINLQNKRNIHDMMRIPKTETHLKVFRCLFCDGGKLFVGMSEESFMEHVNRQHGKKAATRKPENLQRECRICSDQFETDLTLTRHIKRNHIEKGPQNHFPFAGFGPREDEDEDEETGVVEVVEAKTFGKSLGRREKKSRRRSSSESDSVSDDEIRRGIEKARRKRHRLDHELWMRHNSLHRESRDARQQAAEEEKEVIGPDIFKFKCALCGFKDVDQFKVFEHLDIDHRLGDDEQVLGQKTFKPRAVLACRFCEQVWHGEPTRYKAEMRAHREQAHREENVAVKECFVLRCKGCPTNFDLDQEAQLVRHIEKCTGWKEKALKKTFSNINKHLVAGAIERRNEMREPSSRREERSRSRESSRARKLRDDKLGHCHQRQEMSGFRDRVEERQLRDSWRGEKSGLDNDGREGSGHYNDQGKRSRYDERRREERPRHEGRRDEGRSRPNYTREGERSRHDGREGPSGSRDPGHPREERKPWGGDRSRPDDKSFGRDRGRGFERGGRGGRAGRGGRGGFERGRGGRGGFDRGGRARGGGGRGRGRGGGGNFAEDWVCAKCGFDNWARNWECKKCQAPKPESGQNANLAPLGQDRGSLGARAGEEPPAINYMEDMRRQIELQFQKAQECRTIVEAILTEVLDSVDARVAGTLRSDNDVAGEEMAGSPDYQPPASPDYIPPEDDFTTEPEASESPKEFKCGLCMVFSSFEVFEVYAHLEEVHGIEDDEEKLSKFCIPFTGSAEDEVRSGTPVVGVEANDEQLEPMANLMADKDDTRDTAEGVDNIEAEAIAVEPNEHGEQSDNTGDDKVCEGNDAMTTKNQNGDEEISIEANLEERGEEKSAESSSSQSSSVVTTMEELQVSLAKSKDFKFVASEELTNSEEFKTFMKNQEEAST